MAANARMAVDFILSAGQLHDAPQGRLLMDTVGKQKMVTPLIMDRAYEDDYTRYTAQMLKFDPIVPLKSNRKEPWEYDKERYKLRNEIERLFRECRTLCVNGMNHLWSGQTEKAFTRAEDRATVETDPSAGRGLAGRQRSGTSAVVFLGAWLPPWKTKAINSSSAL